MYYLLQLKEDGVFGNFVHGHGGMRYNFTLQLSTNVYESGVMKSSDVVRSRNWHFVFLKTLIYQSVG